ncbi:MAG: carotenoid biosynthesis protein [Flavobacteriales bacterium]
MSPIERIEDNKKLLYFGVFQVWLFHVSGIIGMSLGYADWFLPKTILNLSVALLFLILCYPIFTSKSIKVAAFVFMAGMTVEWIGVHNDWLFGSYYYGENLGPKIYGVPCIIGANWLTLTFITSAMVKQKLGSKWLEIAAASGLMIFIDFFIEVSAPPFDFWIWTDGEAPLRNFVAWFTIAFVLNYAVRRADIKWNSIFSWNVYLAQLVFFMYFYFFPLF